MVEDFARALQEDPTLISRLKKGAELDDFKVKYNVERATPLKCPVCSIFLQSPGSLWINKDDPTQFVCRKCKLEFTLICNTVDNGTLISDLRKAVKNELTTLSWFQPETKKEVKDGK